MDFLLERQTDDEKIAQWNATQSSFQSEITLDKLFIQQAKASPHAIALIDEFHSITYKELDERSNQLANYIVNQHFSGNLVPDTLIGLFLERSFDTVIAILAILKTGAAYVPIDPRAPKHRVDYILENSKCKLILTHKVFVDNFADGEHQLIFLDEKSFLKQDKVFTSDLHQPHHLAYVLYTSGTTGKPKGVAIPHIGIVNRLEWMQNQYQLRANDIVLQKTPYTFDVSVWELLLAHHVGASTFIPKPDAHHSPQDLYQLLTRFPITVMHFVPSMLNAFNKYLSGQHLKVPKTLRYIFCSGEALFPTQVNGFYALCEHALEVHNLYGPTEASVDVTYSYCKPGCEKVFIGKPIQNIQIHILSENLKPCSIDEIGELHIEGVGLAREYVNQAELTHERFFYWQNKRLYKTGDLASWTSHGEIEYFGRNDSQVKIRGYRIELGEIEQVLAKYPGVAHVAVLCKTRGEHTYLVAFYQAGFAIENNKMTEYLKSYLPHYMIPSHFIFLKDFPLNSNGKLCRKTLSDYEEELPNKLDKLGSQPKNKNQIKLAEIWREALHIDQINIDDNFFFLGGHSLAAAYILVMIQEVFKKQIEMPDFYKAPTIEHLEKLLKKAPKMKLPHHSKKHWDAQKKLPLTEFQVLLWLSQLFEPQAKKMNIVTRKRLNGSLDIQKLNEALKHLVINQAALRYKISKLFPYQYESIKKNISSDFEVYDLTSEKRKVEKKLSCSMDELISFNAWKLKAPLIKARYFQLANNQIEIQLCMSHMICDESSMRILWDELSNRYLALKISEPQASFKDYIIEEQYQHDIDFAEKQKFWEQYLSTSSLFVFPPKVVITNMQKKGMTYSKYYEISEQLIEKLRNYSACHSLNLNALLCSILSISLEPFCQNYRKKRPLINIIKSTRNHTKYNSIIGCMIRVEPVVAPLDETKDILSLSKNIQEQLANISKYQSFSSLMKFAFYSNCYKFRKWFGLSFVRFGMPIYTKLIQAIKIPYLNLKPFHYAWRLASFDRKNIFLVNLNLWNNFLTHDTHETECFGLPACELTMVPHELTKIDDLLDVCFIRDHSNHHPYLVLSGNLSDEFKNHLAEKIITLCQSLKVVSC